MVAKGVDVREADFANPDSLERADHLLLICIDVISQRSELHDNAVNSAQIDQLNNSFTGKQIVKISF